MKYNFKKFIAMGLVLSNFMTVSAFADDLKYDINDIIAGRFAPAAESEIKEYTKCTIYIVGDSTACEYGYDENYAIPREGWGMHIADFFDSDYINVVDLALGGRSSKSFTKEENYQKLKDNLQKGDILLIQFGHNDQKKSTEEDLQNRYTNPEGDKETEGSFQKSLYDNYIKLAEEKGATPVLITPISRRKFDENGKIVDTHGLYDDAVRELAKDTGVFLIDMTEVTEMLYNGYGEEATKIFHATYKDVSKGIDNTHLSKLGAKSIATFISTTMMFKLNGYVLPYKSEDKKLTRGQYINDIMRVMGQDKGDVTDTGFKDVPVSYKYSAAIANAKKMGIVNGDENGCFKPDENITAYDMIVIFMRALKANGIECTEVDAEELSEIKRLIKEIDFPEYAKSDVIELVDLTYSKLQDYTRGYVAAIAELACESTYKEEVKDGMQDVLLAPLYDLISEKENAKVVEQDINELEKVETTK